MALRLAAEEYERKEAARIEAERVKREASIEKRQIQHETKTVLGELAESAEDELDLGFDEGIDVEQLDLLTAPSAAGDLPKPAVTTRPPDAKPALSNAAVAVKKVAGRLKRSARQRAARQRQKRAWAVQEAKKPARSQAPRASRTRSGGKVC